MTYSTSTAQRIELFSDLSESPRPTVNGKFVYIGDEKFYIRGVTYGAFRPDSEGHEYHDLDAIERDFSLMARIGLNAVRIPHTTPPVHLLDSADRYGLRVMVGLSAEQYVGYLIDKKGAPDIDEIIRGYVLFPVILLYSVTRLAMRYRHLSCVGWDRGISRSI